VPIHDEKRTQEAFSTSLIWAICKSHGNINKFSLT
jgi:hypothetical protein